MQRQYIAGSDLESPFGTPYQHCTHVFHYFGPVLIARLAFVLIGSKNGSKFHN